MSLICKLKAGETLKINGVPLLFTKRTEVHLPVRADIEKFDAEGRRIFSRTTEQKDATE